MSAVLLPNDMWEHTLTEIFNYDPKSQMGIILKAWVKENNMEKFSTVLSYKADKFTPTGSLCHYKDKADPETLMMMPTTPL